MHISTTCSRSFQTTGICSLFLAVTVTICTVGSAQDNAEETAVTIPQLKEEYRRLQDATIKKAKQLIGPHAEPLSANKMDALRGELRAALNDTFEVGQKLLAAEVRMRQQQIKPLEQQIADRKRMKQQIIDQRLAELLTPKSLSWEPKFQSAAKGNAPMSPYPSPVSPAIVGPKRLPKTGVAKQTSDAVVWMEIVISERSESGDESFSAAYVNGTVVSADGLVAVALGPGTTREETELAIGSATIFTKDGRSCPAKLVQCDADYGVALLKCAAADFWFLQPARGPVANGRRLTFHGVRFDPNHLYDREDGTTHWKTFVNVISADYKLGENSGFFTVETMFTDDSVGAAFVSLDGQLTGILGGSIHQSYDEQTVGAPPQAPPRKRSSSWAIPAHAIAKLVDAYRESSGKDVAKTALGQTSLPAESRASLK